MKDDSVWMVIEDGKPLTMGIRCEGGKEAAKDLRKKKETETGRKWKSKKVTERELKDAALRLQPV